MTAPITALWEWERCAESRCQNIASVTLGQWDDRQLEHRVCVPCLRKGPEMTFDPDRMLWSQYRRVRVWAPRITWRRRSTKPRAATRGRKRS